MPDVFLSYSREDQAIARRFAEALERAGFSVWWDVALRSGQDYDDVTEQSLRDARAVVVLWSKTSVASRWVRAEATLADRLQTLVPVTIGPCERPILFELKQTVDLSGWDGRDADPAWSAVLADVRRLAGRLAVAAAIPASVPAPEARRLSVCVLPFANMSGDPEQEYFSDGISEDIITDLSKVSSLRVIARNSAFAFKGRHVDVRRVARELDVTHVLEGSVRKAANRVRITAQLIDGTTDGHVWAERWDRDLTDIFALQDEISGAIVGALQQKLLPMEKRAIEERETTDFATYDKYLRARAVSIHATSEADYRQAEEMLREVIAREPGFASALGQLTVTCYFHEGMLPDQRQAARHRLNEAVRESLSRTPAHWGTHLALGYLHVAERRWLEALQSFETVKAIAPAVDTAVTHVLGLVAVGRFADAVRELEAARSKDPLDVRTSMNLHEAYYVLGRRSEAMAEFERSRDLPGTREPQEHTAFFQLWESGDLDLARAQFRRVMDTAPLRFPHQERMGELLDQPEAALALLRKAFDDPACQDGTGQMVLALYAGHFGDDELAVKALRRCYIDYGGNFLIILWFPGLAGARQTSAFKQLARDLGVYDYWRKSGNWGDFARPVGEDDFQCQ